MIANATAFLVNLHPFVLDPALMKKFLLLTWPLCCSLVLPAFAQGKLELQQNDTLRSVLERQVGQVVDLRLSSGEKIGGKIEKVTDKLVQLSQLAGAEFFDGVVDLEQVAAVAVRTTAK